MKYLYFTLFILFSINLGAQVENDDCANAIPIGEVSDLDFSNINATSGGPLHLNSPCPGSAADPILDSFYNDIWYLYTASFTGLASFSLCNSADFDTKIAVYRPGSACPPMDSDLLTCNEDGANCATTSELVFDAVEGESYLLRVAGFGEDTPGEEGTGSFSVEQFVPIVANDFCSLAFPISTGLGQNVNSIGATTDGPIHDASNPCFGFGDITIQADVWYVFTPDFTGPVLWSTCDNVTFDTRLGVYGPDIDCTTLAASDLLACNDDGSGCSSYTSQLFFDVEEGRTYHLRLGGFNATSGSGTFDLINQTPPEPPANDLCANAEDIGDISMEVPVTGSTINAGFDPATFQFPTCLGNQGGGEFAEVWYTFNNAGFQEVAIELFPTSQDGGFIVDVWENCTTQVDTLQVLSDCSIFDPDAAISLSDTFGLLAPVPTDYVLRISTRLTGSLPGNFEFILIPVGTVSTFQVPDALSGEIVLSPNPVNNNITLEIPLNERSELSYTIQDMLGRQISSYNIGTTLAGVHNEYIDASDLTPGVYIINLLVNNQPVGVKFIKQ